MPKSRSLLIACSFLVSIAGCADDGSGAPAAPTSLTAEPLSGGAHLTWEDNSDNETQFMVMRMEDGVDTELQIIATVPFNTSEYHDAPLTPGATYVYMVMAMNDDGESESNEVEFIAP